MKLTVLGSSSKGNCYILQSGSSKLLLECGISWKDVKKALDFNLSGICGCLISHEHKDHCKAVEDVIKAGIDVYASRGTLESCGVLDSHRSIVLEYENQIDRFIVRPFKTEHDAAEPLGFMIYDTKTKEKLLFATDTYYLRYTFPKLDYIMIECNYDREVLRENIENGLIPASLKDRLLESHFALHNVKEFLTANDLRYCKQIVLLHLSDSNSDPEKMKLEIEELTGIPTIVAVPGMKLEVEKYPF